MLVESVGKMQVVFLKINVIQIFLCAYFFPSSCIFLDQLVQSMLGEAGIKSIQTCKKTQMPQSQRHIKYQYKIQTKCSVEKTHHVSKKCPKKCQQKCPKKWMWYLYFRMSQKWKYYNYGCMWMATISFVKTFSIDLLKRLFDIHVEKVLIIQYTTGKIRYR